MAGIERSVDIDSYKKELLVNLLREIASQDVFPRPLADRLQQLIGEWDYKNYIRQNNLKISDTNEFNPLDLEFKSVTLTPTEKKTIQMELEKTIINLYPSLLEEFYKITGGKIKKNLKDEDCIASELTREQKSVIELCNRYYEDLKRLKGINIEMCNLMKEWIDLRLGDMARKMMNKAEMCNLRSRLLELEASIVKVQVKRFVYCGKVTTVKDYMDYYNSLKETLEEHKVKIIEYKKFLKGNNDSLD